MINQSGKKAKLPVFLFFGEEDFLIDETVGKFKRQIINPDLNLELLDGRSLSPAALSAALRTQPLLGGEKLVIIRDFEVVTEEQEQLISFLKDISPDLKVVFCAAAIDKRSKFYKFIDGAGEVVEFKPYAPWEQDQLTAWIRERVAEQGKKISPGAARVLQEIAGSNLRLLSGEIGKIVTYIGDRAEIAEEDVLSLAAAGEASAFSLMDALRDKDLKKSLALFQVLLKNKEDIFSLMGLMSSQYRLMLQVKSLGGRETDPNRIARLIGGSPYYIRKCSSNLGRFTLAELKQDLARLLAAGQKIKTGELQTTVLELLMADLCRN